MNLNLKQYYKDETIPENFNIIDEGIKYNCNLYNFIFRVYFMHEDPLKLYKPVLHSYLKIAKETIRRTNATEDEMFKRLKNSTTELSEYFKTAENFCRFLGTSSEETNYTIDQTFSMIIALLINLGLKVEF